MTLDFTCQGCDATFEVELADLVEEPTVECPTCEARAPRAAVEAVTAALDELLSRLAQLRPRFVVALEVESDDLPAAYEQGREEEQEEKDDEGSWDEEAAGAEEDEEDR